MEPAQCSTDRSAAKRPAGSTKRASASECVAVQGESVRPPWSRASRKRERGVGWDVRSDFEDDLGVWLERDVAR